MRCLLHPATLRWAFRRAGGPCRCCRTLCCLQPARRAVAWRPWGCWDAASATPHGAYDRLAAGTSGGTSLCENRRCRCSYTALGSLTHQPVERSALPVPLPPPCVGRDVYNERPVGELTAAAEAGVTAVGPAAREQAGRLPVWLCSLTRPAAARTNPPTHISACGLPKRTHTNSHTLTNHCLLAKLAAVDLPRGAIIHTNRGDIWLKLFPDEASRRRTPRCARYGRRAACTLLPAAQRSRACAHLHLAALCLELQQTPAVCVLLCKQTTLLERQLHLALPLREQASSSPPTRPPACSAQRRWRTSPRTPRTATTTASSSTASSRASCCRRETRWVRCAAHAAPPSCPPPTPHHTLRACPQASAPSPRGSPPQLALFGICRAAQGLPSCLPALAALSWLELAKRGRPAQSNQRRQSSPRRWRRGAGGRLPPPPSPPHTHPLPSASLPLPIPAGNGTGGESIWGGEFPDEITR